MPFCIECSSIDGVDVRGSCDGLQCQNCGRDIRFDSDMCLVILSDLRKPYEDYMDDGGAVAYNAKNYVEKYKAIKSKVLDGSVNTTEEFMRLTYLS